MRRFTFKPSPILAQVFPWPLVNLANPTLSMILSAGMLLTAMASRLLLMADGPWEQDEALLGCGVMDFDLARHMPMPPGFPLWIAIGRMMRFLGEADPVRAMQIAGALFSVAGLWALVGLWDGLVERRVALAGAALAAFIPGIWFHSIRAFTETPSAACTIIALALWLRGGRRGFIPGVLAITAAALIRPPLAPFFLLACVIAAWVKRKEPGLLVRAVGSALSFVFVVLTPAVVETGGITAFLQASFGHASEHVGGLGSEAWGVLNNGFTRGLANPVAAVAFLTLAIIGWLTLHKTLRSIWWMVTGAALWVFYLLLFLHNPTYPRYWVMVWLLLATPAVIGATYLLRSTRLGTTLAWASAALAAWWTFPGVAHIHSHPLPVISALRTVASEGRGTLVFEDQLFSFRNLATLSGALNIESLRQAEMKLTQQGFGAAPLWFLGEGDGQDIICANSQVIESSCTLDRVITLSQRRFLQVRLVKNPVLVWRGGSYVEWEGIERYIWCRADTTLLLPAAREAGHASFAAEVHRELGVIPYSVWVNGSLTATGTLPPGRQVIRFPFPKPSDARRPVEVRIHIAGEVKSRTDTRMFAIRLFRAAIEAPPYPAPIVATLPEPNALQNALAQAEGFYPPELMGNPPQAAAWTGPKATVQMAVGRGTVVVELLAARPQGAEVEVRLGSALTRLVVGAQSIRVALPVPVELARGGLVNLEISSTVFIPGGADQRTLGVAVAGIWYLPEPTASVPLT